MTLVACGDDAASDGAMPSDAGLIDSFLVDTGAQLDGAPAPTTNPRITFINAAHDLGSVTSGGAASNATVRLCFAAGLSVGTATVAPFAPLPDVTLTSSATLLPGVDQGRGLTLPSIAVSLADHVIVPIVVASESIVQAESSNTEDGKVLGTLTCDQLVGASHVPSVQLQEGIDMWTMPAIGPGTLTSPNAYVFALTGCASNATTPNPGKCGPGFVADSGTGNVALRIYQTNGPPVAPSGASFLHLSTAANAYLSQSGERALIHPALSSPDLDGGFDNVLSIASADPPLFGLSNAVPVPSLTVEQSVVLGPTTFSVGVLGTSFGLMTLESGLDSNTNPYTPGASYVFVAVGDPDPVEQPGGSTVTNIRYFHFLGFPASP